MVRAWRIVRERHADSAFSGEGAFRVGGRWNSRGTRVVYSSASQALAVLESLVHLNPPVVFRYVSFAIEFDEELVMEVGADLLPANWREQPVPPSTRALGDAWIRSKKSAVLAVPSVVVPGEANYLLNPLHPEFGQVVIHEPVPYAFDSRLLR